MLLWLFRAGMLMPMTYGFKNRVLLLQPDDGVYADLGHLHLSRSMIRHGDETGSAALDATSGLISSSYYYRLLQAWAVLRGP